MMAFINRLRTSLKLARSTVLPEDKAAQHSMLFSVIMANQHRILQQWLDSSLVDVNAVNQSSRRSYLITAASIGALECLTLLLKKGAHVNFQDAAGNTALTLAARNGHRKCVKKLIEHGADMLGRDISGLTGLHWICASNVKADILLEVLPAVNDINIEDLQGQTCLHLASKNGMDKVVQVLLDHGAAIDRQSHAGETPLHLACRYGHICIVETLLDRGAQYLPTKQGELPLQSCVQGAYEKTALLLVQRMPHLLDSIVELAASSLPEQHVHRTIVYVATKLEALPRVCQQMSSLATAHGLKLLTAGSSVDAEIRKLLDVSRMLARLVPTLPAADVESAIKPVRGLLTSLNEWLILLDEAPHSDGSMETDDLTPMIPRVCAAVEAVYVIFSAGSPREFLDFVSASQHVLTCLVQRSPELILGHFSFMLKLENASLQFAKAIRSQSLEKRKTWFYEELQREAHGIAEATGSRGAQWSRSSQVEELLVTRASLFRSSCHELLKKDSQLLKSGFSIKFADEEGIGHGLIKEWFDVLSLELLNPDYALFTRSADGCTFQPNSQSYINPDHLNYFNFAGQIIGLALYHKEVLGIYFTRSFYKHLLGVPVSLADIASIDPEYAKNLQWILDNDIDGLGLDLNFSVETDVFGTTELIELVPGGTGKVVTDNNKVEYAQRVADLRTTRAIQPQIDSFLQGFHKFIPRHLIRMFNEFELEILISGLPYIDVDDWQNNTEYIGYSNDSPQIEWFWEFVHTLPHEQLALLLQFVTGTSRVPHGGFAHLPGNDSVIKFTISHATYRNQILPTASTCVNLLRLPEYTSKAELCERLNVALTCGGSTGFAMA